MNDKIHVIKDESLGGVLREYVEVDRKADVGDYVAVIVTNSIAIISNIDGSSLYIHDINIPFRNGWVDSHETRTLEPTDIVQIDGKRYRMVEREAEVGEKVIVTDKGYGYPLGTVTKCEFSGCDTQISDGSRGIKHRHYLVLEPIKPTLEELTSKITTENKHEPIAVDETEASPSVVEMLGNLAQRIAKLEREFNEMEKALSSNQTRASRAEKKADLMQDEIDTLHTNQKRIAEELETLKHETDSSFTNIDLLLTEVADKLAERIYFNFLRAGGNRE